MADPLVLPQLMTRAGGAVGRIAGLLSLPYVTSNSARQPLPAWIVVPLSFQLSPSRHRLLPMFRTTVTRDTAPPVLHWTWMADALPQVMIRGDGVAGVGRGAGAGALRRYVTSNSPRQPLPAQISVSP
jgi:hypothetical protein